MSNNNSPKCSIIPESRWPNLTPAVPSDPMCSCSIEDRIGNYRNNYDSGLAEILVTSYKFEFSKGLKGSKTFEEKVRSTSVNDLGTFGEEVCGYAPETAHIMINEFRKFMAFNAFFIKDMEDSGKEFEGYKETVDGVKYYESELVAPVHIDRIWKLLILHSNTYFEYCMELCGGYIDRLEPSFLSESEISEKIKSSIERIAGRAKDLCEVPYLNIREHCYYQGYNPDSSKLWKYERMVSLDSSLNIFGITSSIDQLCQDQNIESFNFKDVSEIADTVSQSLSNDEELDLNLDLDNITFNNEDTEMLFYEIMNIPFPQRILNNFKCLWSLSDQTITFIFIYYVKFLVIATLNEYKATPTYWVDQFWHSHMVDTKHYRDTCIHIHDFVKTNLSHLNINVRKFMGHQPSNGTEECKEQLQSLDTQTHECYTTYFNDELSSNFIFKYKGPIVPFKVVNLIGLVTTYQYRKDPLSPDNLLIQKMSESSKTVKKMLSNPKTFFRILKYSNVQDVSIYKAHQKRLSDRKEKYKKKGFFMKLLQKMKTNEQHNQVPMYEGWRKNYKVEHFDWYDRQEGKQKKYSIKNEPMVFSPRGMIFITCFMNVDSHEILLTKNYFYGPGNDCTLPNLADSIQSEMDIYPLSTSPTPRACLSQAINNYKMMNNIQES